MAMVKRHPRRRGNKVVAVSPHMRRSKQSTSTHLAAVLAMRARLKTEKNPKVRAALRAAIKKHVG